MAAVPPSMAFPASEAAPTTLSPGSLPGGAAPAKNSSAPPSRSSPWLLSPALDMLFVANLLWPVAAVLTALFAETQVFEAYGYLLAFFIIMPHRWITLPLVFGDRQIMQQRPLAILGVLTAIVFLGSLGTFTLATAALLVAVDYLWNAWHFAAQHSGIARIYDRLGRPATNSGGWIEKCILRGFFLFALLRLTGMFTPPESHPWLEWTHGLAAALSVFDWPMLAVLGGFVLYDVAWRRPFALSRSLYLLSVTSLYATLLIAIRHQWPGLILGCAGAATLFHSTEYMAVVSWHVPRRHGQSDSWLWRQCASRWLVSLLAFMAFFAVTTWLIPKEYLPAWFWINLLVSFLHYAYDGMIWKRPRKPQPAAAAGLAGATSSR